MYKKCKVVMLPSNQTGEKLDQLFKENGNLFLSHMRWTREELKEPDKRKYQHLYILSDEEINANDLISDGIKLWQLPVKLDGYINLFKVIASTNSSLNITGYDDDSQPMDRNGNIAKQFSSIPQSFIDKYVSEYNKGKQIIDIFVEYEEIDSNILIANETIAEVYALNAEEDNAYETKLKSLGGANRKKLILKLSPDNTINIKSIKDSWTRDEVIELCKTAIIDGSHSSTFDFDEWIESNL